MPFQYQFDFFLAQNPDILYAMFDLCGCELVFGYGFVVKFELKSKNTTMLDLMIKIVMTIWF